MNLRELVGFFVLLTLIDDLHPLLNRNAVIDACPLLWGLVVQTLSFPRRHRVHVNGGSFCGCHRCGFLRTKTVYERSPPAGNPAFVVFSAVAVPDGPGRRLSPVPGIDLAVDATDVVPGRDLSDEEGSGDLLIGQAPGEQGQDLPLAGTELHR